MTSGLPRTVVVKLGGELLETPERLAGVVGALAQLGVDGPLVVVHGGGKEIDAECARRGIQKVAVDGLRVTDAATLEAVVAVLAGSINTRLVAALTGASVRAVGLTGADGACVRVTKAPPHRAVDGRVVDLGLVGVPVPCAGISLVGDLLRHGYVPVLACLGVDADGALYNINADTLAAHVAIGCGASHLVIAGATGGVLGRDGARLDLLDLDDVTALVADGTASAGMVAKLSACRAALDGGVDEVSIVDGRSMAALLRRDGTRIVARHGARTIG